MTGYNGVLGYRTDIAYKTGENLQDDQKKFLEDNPDLTMIRMWQMRQKLLMP